MSVQRTPQQSAAEARPGAAGPCPEAHARNSAPGPAASQSPAVAPPRRQAAPPRLHAPDRGQLISAKTIDELLEPDHPARAVWAYVERLDLTALYDRIRARGSIAGRPAIDPRLLVGLWLYATLSGCSSARELADWCRRHDAFRWLAGGVSVNYHSLADFRTDNLEFLDGLLTQSVELLRREGSIDLGRIAIDGMRVRASAGAASFRRRQTLERLLQEAHDEVRKLKRQLAEAEEKPLSHQEVAANDPAGASAGQRAAAIRHAEEKLERVEQAVERLAEAEAKAEPGQDRQPRVSTTDPEATVMKMADGGFRPAYNVQYATECQGQVTVGVEVLTKGSDQGQLPGMIEQVQRRFGERPGEVLTDGGFVKLEDIEEVQGGEKRCEVYAPVPAPRKEGVDRHEPKKTDSPEVAAWRRRMATAQAKEVYKQRGAFAECVNAHARNRGMQQFTVRGVEKVKAVALWFALAQNMARFFSLRPQLC